ncbi:aspartyl-tRNA synthetase [Nematocida parisii]|uniref:aspartate-tRNA ligase n=1 Tax=Nematocida parisii (strain ERTm1 / ATCC PRA-289) TaxID=881290 RepID=UPI000264B678|nr:aspartate-tRNA ligase [Nematocida parisii ERTm1]KAI5127011.1 aspartyl-tRNA synthetase [Nematocida parisii]EIJ94977.1 aspartate-tRNA ligase [Nematocida parisii ERTm1]KAI5128327.1 aspartyl-tRNA synthetase [Nematocida parisii]KAI5144946.1 aspartyl-tRNA synthetase [Nematocida parisii]KAI5154656.1 aspartyl-tRNA synthetase [Nematocida parisii]|eukprot:XP_013058333.1 aspartate-tRNA ligase [Nematocida parisii ERTm1]
MKVEEMQDYAQKEIREISVISAVEEPMAASLYGFIKNVRMAGKKKVFIVLRQGLDTIQCVGSVVPGESEKYSPESYVCVQGKIVNTKTPVHSCTVKHLEVQVDAVSVLSVSKDLPFQLKDLDWLHSEREKDPQLPVVNQSKRLDARYIDLRSMETQSIFRAYSSILSLFRAYLEKNLFIEIKTPKILKGSSEGGCEVFPVSYFGQPATLAQSPQLYKQMAIIGGLERVFEIAPCFRAENSNTGRHLTEFTGVDIEMELKNKTYIDLVRFIYGMIKYVSDGVQERNQKELSTIKDITAADNQTVIAEAPVIITFKEGIDILRSIGREASYTEDIGTEDEKILGQEVRKRYGSDLFAMIEYPESARPFYTSLLPSDSRYTQSFDFILKGEEITSGAERINIPETLKERVLAKGMKPESVKDYIDAFEFGAPRHGGCGIGLERVVKLLTGCTDIHKCSMFPRDPRRLQP